MKRGLRSLPVWPWALLLLLLLSAAFWYARIIAPAEIRQLTIAPGGSVTGSFDLYSEHHPMAAYGFGELRSGRVPLWNPYQLCGMPFLAIPHTGLFYPGNLPHLFFETGAATEITYVAHLWLAGGGMWLLARSLGFGPLAALASALTFMWSGWMTYLANHPSLVSGMSWLPLTMLLIEHAIWGRRAAPLALAVAVACQLLNGATEYFVYTMYVGALFALLRLAPLAREGRWRRSAGRGLVLLGSVAAGVLLSAPQLLPSLELVGQSVRAGGALTLERALDGGGLVAAYLPPDWFLFQTLQGAGESAVGVLPILGVALGLGLARQRGLWIFGLATALGAALLVSGGPVYEWYFRTPIGGLFRRPIKFLHVYAFAQALMAAIAVQRLAGWRLATRRALWSQTAWIAGLALLGGGLLWLVREGASNLYLVASLGLLLLFGAVGNAVLRGALVVSLVLVHGADLFLGARNPSLRPSARPEVFEAQRPLFESLRQAAGHDRVYIPPGLQVLPHLTAKQGTLQRVRLLGDYEPLALRRYGTFFESASNTAVSGDPTASYTGRHELGRASRWRLMDLTSTRLYVASPQVRLAKLLVEWSRHPDQSGFVELRGHRDARVYERRDALPRAYFVGGARVLAGADSVLAELESPGFDPRREVLLEAEPGLEAMPSGRSRVAEGRARILEDGPERVLVEVKASQPGYLVLTDAHYPGWRARVDGRRVPIHRANYLFRAVRVGPGRSLVAFEYRPASFRGGLLVCGATAALLVSVAAAPAVSRRRARRRPARDGRDRAAGGAGESPR